MASNGSLNSTHCPLPVIVEAPTPWLQVPLFVGGQLWGLRKDFFVWAFSYVRVVEALDEDARVGGGDEGQERDESLGVLGI